MLQNMKLNIYSNVLFKVCLALLVQHKSFNTTTNIKGFGDFFIQKRNGKIKMNKLMRLSFYYSFFRV